MQYIFSISGLVNLISALLIALLVLQSNKKNLQNVAFLLLLFSNSWWSFGYWQAMMIYNDPNLAFFWLRFLNLGSIFTGLFCFHWILSLLEIKQKKLLFFYYVLTIFYALFSFSDKFIANIRPISWFAFWPTPGPVYLVYLVTHYAILLPYMLFLLIKAIRKSTPQRKTQIYYVLFGILFAYTAAGTNFFLWFGINIAPYGNFVVFLYPAIFAYAIIKHRLMDIKVALRGSTVYLLSFVSIISIAVLIEYLARSILLYNSEWIDVFVLILALATFNSVKKYFYYFANKYFFSSLYDPTEVIDQLSSKLKSTIEISSINKILLETVLSAFHAQKVAILRFHKKNQNFSILYNNDFSNDGLNKIIMLDTFGPILAAKETVVSINDLKIENNLDFKNVYNGLVNNGVELILPLRVKTDLVGYLLLGAKESGDMYNDDDLRVLRMVGSQGAIAIQNAKLYEKILDFRNQTEKEISKKRQELINANNKLIKLDDAKSEFVSIASHQLRTPLTVIKGYVSMLLEGNFGPVLDKHQAPLEKVFLSNERLVQLVDNLLTISRLESGRLQYKFAPAQLEDIVDQAIKQFISLSKKTNIKLIWNKPAIPLPIVNVDSEKIRIVVLHMIDNSFRYTKQGSITIKIEQIKDVLRFSIFDTGVGIIAEDMPNLFQKFARGEGTFLLHTEGTGLGLYVAKEMVVAHHGRIWAESDGLGRGSRFFFEIPMNVLVV